MAVADSLRPTLLRLARELRPEKIAGVSSQQVGLLVSIKYTPGVTVGQLAAEERVSTAAMSKRVSRLERDGLVARTQERGRPPLHRSDTDRGRPAHPPPRPLPPHRMAREPSRRAVAGRARRGGSGGGAARAAPRGREGARLTKAARRTFQSLRYRNYRLFFGGQIVSQTGSWMQRIALGWYVLQLTHSPFDVGVMAFAQFTPYMVFGLFAGVLADRLDARRTVIGTQTRAAHLGVGARVDRARRLRGAVDALHDRLHQRDGARARRAVAPAAHVPDGRPRRPAERDRAQLDALQRVADLRPGDRRHRARRRRGRLLPHERDQLPRRADLPAPDARLGVLPAASSSSGRRSSPARARGSRGFAGSRGCSSSSRSSS